MSDSKLYDYFLDMFRSLRKGEISIFKVQFIEESQNLYLNDDHATNILTEEARELIDDKTIVYVKIACSNLIRDIKDLSSDEIKHEKEDPIKFIQNRLLFGKNCKDHAKLSMDDNEIGDAMKIYRKGQGAMKMVSKDVVKSGKTLIENNQMEEAKFDELLKQFEVTRVQLMLNQGLCHWKKSEWSKMKQVNSEIIKNHDPENVKAMYRFSLACKEVESYDEGIVSFNRKFYILGRTYYCS